jgi:hypothetical protein
MAGSVGSRRGGLCTLFKVARSALSYQGRKAARDALAARMRELSAQYPRHGDRRIRIFLGRDSYRMSPGRACRLWRAAGLQLPRKRPRKRVAAARPRLQAPCGPNQVWSYDFVFDHWQWPWRVHQGRTGHRRWPHSLRALAHSGTQNRN